MNIEELSKQFKEISESLRDIDDKAERGEKLVEASVTFTKLVEELETKNKSLEDLNSKYEKTMRVNDSLYSKLSDAVIPTPKTEEEKLIEKVESKEADFSDFSDLL